MPDGSPPNSTGTSPVTSAVVALRRALPDVIAFGLAFEAATVVIAAPIGALALRGLLATTGRTVVSNTDLLRWASTPGGFVSFAVIAVVWGTVQIAQLAGLTVIAAAAWEGRRVTWRDALGLVLRRAAVIVAMTAHIALRVCLLLAPFVAVGAAAAAVLLGEHDINWYLATSPREWQVAVAIGGVLVVAIVMALAALMGQYAAVPCLVLVEGVPPRRAYGTSARLLRARLPSAILGVAAWVLVTLLVPPLLSALAGLVARTGLALAHDALHPAAMFLGAVALTQGALLLVWNIVAVSVGAFLCVAAWRRAREATGGVPPVPIGASAPWGPPGRRTGLVAALALVAVVAALAGAANVLAGVRSPDAARVVAHRAKDDGTNDDGTKADGAPENSVAALRQAIAAGAHMAEIDAQRTADGAVVLVHDADLARVAGLPIRVRDSTLAEVKAADIGRGTVWAGERVPTLDEFAAAADGRIALLIELKYYGADPDLLPAVVEILGRHGLLAPPTRIMSFHGHTVDEVRRLAPGVPSGLLTSLSIGDPTWARADFIAVHDSWADAALIARAHGRGQEVFVWTLDDPVALSAAVDRGADGLITDAPSVAAAVLDERAALSPVERLALRAAALYGW
jgi:glycerophosphoryl diester phosphodiesterase